MSYKECLARFYPIGFDKRIKWESVMSVWVTTNDVLHSLSKRSAFGSIFYGLQTAFFDKYKYEISGNHDIVMFYGIYNWRKDHSKTFDNLAGRLSAVTICKAAPCVKVFHPVRGIFSVFLFLIWFFQALCAGCNFVEACNVIRPLALCRNLLPTLNNVLTKKVKLFVTYYDCSPDEAFAVQFAKLFEIKTATLQHGIFAKKNIQKTLGDTAFEYSESASDYYLAWNQYTKDECIKVGMDPDKVIICGIPKYAGFIPEDNASEHKGVFGVILNNSSFDTHNKRLIDSANQISKRIGCKYVIRFHPELKHGKYKELIDESCFAGVSSNDLSISNYSNTVDFSIISSSSVLIDLVYLNKKVYRLIVTDEDTYSTIKMNSFRNVDDFIRLYHSQSDMCFLFDYLCTTYNIIENYQKALRTLIQEERYES